MVNSRTQNSPGTTRPATPKQNKRAHMTGTKKLNIGICGLGFMGRTYFGILRNHAQARVAAVYDLSEKRRSGDWAGEFGNLETADGERADMRGVEPDKRRGQADMQNVRAYASLGEMLADDALDAVAVTLPTPSHADVTIRALQAGKHVICEKPMALRLRDCDRMIGAAEQTGRTLMIAQCVRFWPQYEKIKQLVDDGAIGPVRFATLRRLATAPSYSNDNWMLDHTRSGGALFDLHVHDIDFAQHLLGIPQFISARGSSGPSGGIDHVVATYTYADGRYATLEGGWTFQTPWPFEMQITVCGRAGTLDWSMTRGDEILHYTGGAQAECIEVEAGTGWSRELDYFVDCILNNRPVERCPPASSRTSIALALLEQRAVRSGRRIVVPKCVSPVECARGEQ